MQAQQQELKKLLGEIVLHDCNYELREILVLRALALARELGQPGGIRLDPEEPEWPVVTFTLPGTGEQVSWHMRATEVKYDGHTTEEKFLRIGRYVLGK
jgi:hypothetical protein